MQVHNHILGTVADHHEDAALLALHAIADQRRDAGVNRFSRHGGGFVREEREEKMGENGGEEEGGPLRRDVVEKEDHRLSRKARLGRSEFSWSFFLTKFLAERTILPDGQARQNVIDV